MSGKIRKYSRGLGYQMMIDDDHSDSESSERESGVTLSNF